MKVEDVVTRVRLAIDEHTPDDTSFAQLATDEQEMTRIIVDKIPYALRQVIEEAPLEKLDSDMFLTTLQPGSFTLETVGSDKFGKVKLPEKLLRIVEARLSSWSHYPIPEPSTSQVYLMQLDPYARGSWDRPVNILTFDNQGKKVLEMYCAKEASDTLRFVYIAAPDTSNISMDHLTEDVVKVPEKLEASLVYQVAGLTMMAFREDIAGALLAVSKRYLDGEVKSEE